MNHLFLFFGVKQKRIIFFLFFWYKKSNNLEIFNVFC